MSQPLITDADRAIWKLIKHVIVPLAIISIIIVGLYSMFYTIPAGYSGVLLTFDKASMTAIPPGLHIKFPFAQNIIVMDARTQKYQADLTAASQDLQNVKTSIVINYHITASDAPQIYSTIGVDYSDKVIYPMEQEANKAVTATFSAEEMITKREDVRNKMKELLTSRLAARNIFLEDISIVNFEFSDTFTQAIEAKVTAQQNALKEQNNLQVVQFQAQQVVEKAKGDAQAIQIINQQLQSSPQYVNYLTIQKWNGVMPLSLGSGTLLSITPQIQTAPSIQQSIMQTNATGGATT